MRSRAVLVVLATAALSAVAPSPHAALAGLRSAQWSAANPTGPLVAVLALAAWACGLWLLLVGALCLAEQLPGRYGQLAAWLSRVVAPQAVRRLVAVSLGATAVLGTAGPAAAMSGHDHGTAAGRGTATLDLPASYDDHGWPGQLDWPVTTASPPAVPPPVIAPTPGPAATPPAPPHHRGGGRSPVRVGRRRTRRRLPVVARRGGARPHGDRPADRGRLAVLVGGQPRGHRRRPGPDPPRHATDTAHRTVTLRRTPMSAAPVGSASPPALHLVAAPATEPPYDDEPPAPSATLRLVRSSTPASSGLWDAPAAPTLPDPRAVTHALVQRVLEALAGVRPVAQLQRDTTPEIYQRLHRLAVPTRPGQTRAPHRPSSRSVRSVRAQPVALGVVEACATVQRGRRAGAVAVRLEVRDGRWCCTELVGI